MGTFISTKGRYAIRILIDLAEHSADGRVPLKEMAERQNISLKYMETIMPLLVKEGLVSGSHGKGGGYKLVVPPEDIKIGKVLRATEGTIAAVSCLNGGEMGCERASQCKTLPMWIHLDRLISDYLDTVSIRDLMIDPINVELGSDWVI
ncbi:transcriptional regulator, BadM/Rrf2 family [Thermoplasmatales archaeon BRNA1]|nr:transcriptional regulator, BadM/Rrf2 family [Thermoplasmatales archaeon BRNA1]